MRSSLLRQFPEEIQKKIIDNTIESYELRDAILELIDNNPMFIIRVYLKTEDLRDILEEKDMEYIKSKRKYGYVYKGCSRKFCTYSII
jgi:citrate lyase gamma subunit